MFRDIHQRAYAIANEGTGIYPEGIWSIPSYTLQMLNLISYKSLIIGFKYHYTSFS